MPGKSQFSNGLVGRSFLPTLTKAPFSPRQFTTTQRKVDVLIVGNGPGANHFFKTMAKQGFTGNGLFISNSPRNWMNVIAQNNRTYPLGQTRQTLSGIPHDQLHAPKERMPIGDFLKNEQNDLVMAVAACHSDQWNYLEGTVVRVEETTSGGARVYLHDGTVQEARRVIIGTGPGPERPLTSAGVQVLHSPTGPRVLKHESTTAIVSFGEGSEYYEGERILVYGGSATSAWVAENSVAKGAGELLWISAFGFKGANPNGNNSEIMEATEELRTTSTILSIEYLGHRETGSGIKVTTLNEDKRKCVYIVDKVIAALGADPLQATGVQHVLGKVYNQLRLVRTENGLYASTPGGAVVVLVSALSTDSKLVNTPEMSKFINGLASDAQLPAGIVAVQESAAAAAKAVTEEERARDVVVLSSDQYNYHEED